MYCQNCGHELVAGAKFCQNCGSRTGARESDDQRRTEYAGKVYKCPRCGEVINAFVIHCPSCGHEIRGAKATPSVRELARKLESIEMHRQPSKSNMKIVDETDEKKSDLIRNFPIPNTKEDLYEFFILAASNINPRAYENEGVFSERAKMTSDAWVAKIEQAYQKAVLAFEPDDPSFIEISKIYEKTSKRVHRAKTKSMRQAALSVAIIVGFVVGVFLFITIGGWISTQKEVARLDAIVEEIEVQLENRQYKLALMNAEGLEYDGFIVNEEQSRQWEITQQYWIDRILEEAAENGVELEYNPEEDDEVTVEVAE